MASAPTPSILNSRYANAASSAGDQNSFAGSEVSSYRQCNDNSSEDRGTGCSFREIKIVWNWKAPTQPCDRNSAKAPHCTSAATLCQPKAFRRLALRDDSTRNIPAGKKR
jgi:hypothetical protein